MLDEYRRKRDLRRSSEPEARATANREGPLVFVVHKHAARSTHYDFRIELYGVLKSWAVPRGPSLDPKDKRLAVMVEDHPLDYRFFEGAIPKGEYGAGEVIIWDRGTYSPEEDGGRSFANRAEAEAQVRAGLQKGKISLQLRGHKLKGSFALAKMSRGDNNWLLIKHRDDYGSNNVLADERSVVSGKTLEEIKTGGAPGGRDRVDDSPSDLPGALAAPFPASVAPMLATPAEGPFDDPEWYFEPKLDGFRIITFISTGKVSLYSRGGLDVTQKYVRLVRGLGQQPVSSLVLDGEVIALDEKGKLCFQCLQRYIQTVSRSGADSTEPATPLIYYVFDIPYLDGYDLRSVPLRWRKSLLQTVLYPSESVRLVEHFESRGRTVYQAAINAGLEGVIAKHRDSTYESGRRSRLWLKVKAVQTEDFVIGGYTLGAGNRASTFGALLLGYYRSGMLVFAGHVGTGFAEPDIATLRVRLDRLKTEESPFSGPVPVHAPVVWVRPVLAAEVKFSEYTRSGYLRAPVFLRLRDDKPAIEVLNVAAPGAGPTEKPSDGLVADAVRQIAAAREGTPLDIEGNKVAVSNLDKELWPPSNGMPAITKRGLLTYLAAVSPFLLPHLRNRPLTLSRYPDGIRGERFYQKHWEMPLPAFVSTATLPVETETGHKEFLVCNNLATLLWLGQLANLELHTWLSRVDPGPDIVDKAADSPARFPDAIVFDIDPYIYSGSEPSGAEPELNPTAFGMACQAALWLKDILDSLSLPAFVKTSGRTGIHVYVPVRRKLDFHVSHSVAKTISQFLWRQHPDDITLEWAVERRTGKVFIDYNQNMYGKTLAAAYSPRPTPRATVATPLRWEELTTIYPVDFTILNLPERLGNTGDPWSKMLEIRSDLTRILKSLG